MMELIPRSLVKDMLTDWVEISNATDHWRKQLQMDANGNRSTHFVSVDIFGIFTTGLIRGESVDFECIRLRVLLSCAFSSDSVLNERGISM